LTIWNDFATDVSAAQPLEFSVSYIYPINPITLLEDAIRVSAKSVPEFNGFGSGRLFDLQAKSSDVAEPSRDQNGLVARHLDDYASVNLKPSSNSRSSIEYPCLAC